MGKKRICLSIVLVLLFGNGLTYAQDLTKGLVAHWTFCNCSLKDQTGHGHDGTATRSPSCVSGVFDEAYQFSGNNTIDVPYDPAFNIAGSGALTLSAWVKPMNLTNQYEALFVKGVDFWDYGLYINQGLHQFMFGCNAPNHEVFSKTILTNNQWYFVTGVYDNRKWKIYVNGLPEDSLLNGTPVYQSTNGIGFAKKGAYSRDYFTGSLDELRMYDRALSDDEVLQLYNYKPAASGLALSASLQRIFQRTCFSIDTSVKLNVFSNCGSATAILDSTWITGSSTFVLRNLHPFPLTIASIDSIKVRYGSPTGSSDTSTLHIRYDLGNGPLDTTILLIGKGYVQNPILALSTADEYIVQRNCQPVDTVVTVSVQGLCSGSGMLDSVWLTGSTTFGITKIRTVPRTIIPNDFVSLRYSPVGSNNDTAFLHLRYNVGSGQRDTIITLAGKGHSEIPTVLFANSASYTQHTCDRLDTTVTIQVLSCRADTVLIDSMWLTGSNGFFLSRPALPLRVSSRDMLPISYISNSTSQDTAILHLRYVLAGQQIDTTITLIGRANSRFLNGMSYQHLAIRSGALGDIITMPLSADIGDSITLKASWPNLSAITITLSFDRSKLTFMSIKAPQGWTTTTVNTLANGLQITFSNLSGSYTRPLNLGEATFQISAPGPGMTNVILEGLSLHIGQTDNEVCLSQSEDAEWGIVMRPQADVQDHNRTTLLRVEPNPFDDHILIQDRAGELISAEIFDILGHRISATITTSGPNAKIPTAALPTGSYLLVCHTRTGTERFRLNKLH